MATEYDVAISFAGEDRKVAEALADLLVNEFELSVFYDDYEQAKLWGSFLPEKLFDVYRNKAQYCVVLVSKSYKAKRWTRHEWRSVQERALLDPDKDYLLAVRIDDTELDGLFTSLVYRDVRKDSVRTIARLVYEKAGDFSKQAAVIRLADQKYREGLVEDALALVVASAFDGNTDALRIRANALGKLARYPEAVNALDAIIERYPNDFLAHFHIGIFCFRCSQFDKSVRHYEIADKLSPGHPTIQSDLPLARINLATRRRNAPS